SGFHTEICACFCSKPCATSGITSNRGASAMIRCGCKRKITIPNTFGTEKRSKTMKRLNAAVRLTCWLVALFAMVFLSQAESRDGRFSTTQQKKPRAYVIHIVDQNGRPAISGVPSGGQIFDVAVGQGGLTFDPNELNISVGDTVRWTWFGDSHSVTSGDSCTPDGQFCSPDNMNCDQGILSNTGFVYEFTFAQAGTFSYFCVAHCALGMTGTINVSGGGGCSWSAGPSMPSVG